jgi:hypothetical protein
VHADAGVVCGDLFCDLGKCTWKGGWQLYAEGWEKVLFKSKGSEYENKQRYKTEGSGSWGGRLRGEGGTRLFKWDIQ